MKGRNIKKFVFKCREEMLRNLLTIVEGRNIKNLSEKPACVYLPCTSVILPCFGFQLHLETKKVNSQNTSTKFFNLNLRQIGPGVYEYTSTKFFNLNLRQIGPRVYE